MFAYCLNNPVNGCDPSGKWMWYLDENGEGHKDEYRPIIRYNVPLYNSSGTNLCWSFCEEMISSYKEGKVYTQRQAKRNSIERSKIINGSQKRSEWNVMGWPSDAGEPIEVRSIRELCYILVIYGPLYANYQRDKGGHCIVVTGVDVNNDIVFTNNPWGIQGEQSFSEFTNGVARRWFDPWYEYQLIAVYPSC